METHNGSVYLSGWSSSDDDGVAEQPIRIYNGTSTETLVDPPDIAWRSFVAHGGEMWMAGFRDDEGEGSGAEAGVYRLVDGTRVSITNGTALDGQHVSELLVRSDA